MNKSFSESVLLIKKYSFSSVFFKYWKKLAIVLIIPFILLSCLIYHTYSDIAEREIYSSLNETFSSSSGILEDAFSSIDKNFTVCAGDQYVNGFLQLSADDMNRSSLYTRTILNMFSYFRTGSSYIDSIYLYSFKNKYVLSTINGNYIENFSDRQWYNYYRNHPEKAAFVIHTSDNNGTKQLTFAYTLFSESEPAGIIVFNMHEDVLKKLIKCGSSDVFRIFDDSGKCIYSTSGETDFSLPAKYLETPETRSEKNKNLYLFVKKFEQTHFWITMQSDISAFYSSRRKASAALFLLILLSVAMPVLISLYMSMQFYSSISKIIASLYTMGMENSEEQSGKYDEIMFIIESILKYSGSMAHIENALAQKMSQLKKSQTIALQTQFTPHFLFNTLNHISVTVMNLAGTDNPASRMINLLADLLTISLDTKEYTAKIEDEISYAKKYIEIESIKHENNFDVAWNIDESAFGYIAPKLILQPILENSFKHGINPLRSLRRGKIDISVSKKANTIEFAVTDNGIGLSPEKLEEIRAALRTNDMPETQHIGLCNVNQRIRLIYGISYGCSISAASPGTTVTIVIPCEKEQQKNNKKEEDYEKNII